MHVHAQLIHLIYIHRIYMYIHINTSNKKKKQQRKKNLKEMKNKNCNNKRCCWRFPVVLYTNGPANREDRPTQHTRIHTIRSDLIVLWGI